jgi:hypothetical protein
MTTLADKLACYSKGVLMYADDETGELDPYAWPGGYPVFYLDSNDNVCCPKCASDPDEVHRADDENLIVAGDCNWEDPDLYCDCCNERIESAYADD